MSEQDHLVSTATTVLTKRRTHATNRTHSANRNTAHLAQREVRETDGWLALLDHHQSHDHCGTLAIVLETILPGCLDEATA